MGSVYNFGLFGHSRSGKTILAEAILFKAGAIDRMGDINQGNTTMDYEEEEKRRLMSTNLAVAHFEWKKSICHIVDSPGYMDFIGEQIAAVEAVDIGILNIAADNGVEVGTEKSWNLLKNKQIPVIIFINKLDNEQADFQSTLKQINELFGKRAVNVIVPVFSGNKFQSVVNLLDPENQKKVEFQNFVQNLFDSIAEVDDALMEKYLGGENLTQQEIVTALQKGIVTGTIIPVCCGSGLNQIGVEQLLDFIVNYLPDTSHLPPLKAKNQNNEEIEIQRNNSSPLSGVVFKTFNDPFMGRISYLKVRSGVLGSNSNFYNASQGSKERIGQLFKLKGKKQELVAEAFAGEIVAVAKLTGFKTFDTFSDPSMPVIYPVPQIPEAAVSFSIAPKVKGTEDKLGAAISKIMDEDPTIKIFRDNETNETIISGMGDVHLDVVINKFKEKFGVEVIRGTPKIAYKETITTTATGEGKHKKQTGGRGQYGHCFLRVEPLPRGSGFEFVDEIFGGAIPRQYIPSVEKGVREAMSRGVLAGYPIVDIKVTVYDGSYHVVDSSDIAFQLAGILALQKAVQEAKPVLLEPIMTVEVSVPQEFVGDVMGTINARRGRILEMTAHGNNQVVRALVPLAEMSNYATELRSLTSGRGTFTMSFSHYEEVPPHLAEKIIAAKKSAKEAEKE
ncbi:MAG: elongation factor G [Candidatus Omnitrophica bacterium]|nr:elongation factor G [Candidatus Omnitrophota bacterium]